MQKYDLPTLWEDLLQYRAVLLKEARQQGISLTQDVSVQTGEECNLTESEISISDSQCNEEVPKKGHETQEASFIPSKIKSNKVFSKFNMFSKTINIVLQDVVGFKRAPEKLNNTQIQDEQKVVFPPKMTSLDQLPKTTIQSEFDNSTDNQVCEIKAKNIDEKNQTGLPIDGTALPEEFYLKSVDHTGCTFMSQTKDQYKHEPMKDDIDSSPKTDNTMTICEETEEVDRENNESILGNFEGSEDHSQEGSKLTIENKPDSTISKIKTSGRVSQSKSSSKVVCKICKKILGNASNLIVHLRSHSGSRPFKCDYCDKTFTTTSNKKRHERHHKGQRPFGCDECQAAFTEKKSLITHKLIHSGEKPFECPICQKCFRQKPALQSHMCTHTGQKKFLCDLCGRGFIQPTQYKNHLLRHQTHPEETGNVSCHLCNKVFNTENALEKHRSRYHKTKREVDHDTLIQARHEDHPYVIGPQRKHRCTHCHAQFQQAELLYDHLEIHKADPSSSKITPDLVPIDCQTNSVTGEQSLPNEMDIQEFLVQSGNGDNVKSEATELQSDSLNEIVIAQIEDFVLDLNTTMQHSSESSLKSVNVYSHAESNGNLTIGKDQTSARSIFVTKGRSKQLKTSEELQSLLTQ